MGWPRPIARRPSSASASVPSAAVAARSTVGQRRGAVRTLLDAGCDRERHRLDPEAADRTLPHLARGGVEHQAGLGWCGEPGGRRELRVELTRSPSGVAEEQARALLCRFRRLGLEQSAKNLDRGGQMKAVGDALAVAVA